MQQVSIKMASPFDTVVTKIQQQSVMDDMTLLIFGGIVFIVIVALVILRKNKRI